MSSNDNTPHRPLTSPALLAATVRLGHTLRTLLTLMSGCVDSLRVAVPLGGPAQGALDDLDRAVDQGFRLAHQLVGLSLPAEPDQLVADVNHLINGAAGMIARSLGGGVRIQLRFTATRPYVLGNPSELEWMLLNLVISSHTTIEEGSSLTLQTADQDRMDDGGCRPFVRVTIDGVGPGGVPGGAIHVDLPAAQRAAPPRAL